MLFVAEPKITAERLKVRRSVPGNRWCPVCPFPVVLLPDFHATLSDLQFAEVGFPHLMAAGSLRQTILSGTTTTWNAFGRSKIQTRSTPPSSSHSTLFKSKTTSYAISITYHSKRVSGHFSAVWGTLGFCQLRFSFDLWSVEIRQKCIAHPVEQCV